MRTRAASKTAINTVHADAMKARGKPCRKGPLRRFDERRRQADAISASSSMPVGNPSMLRAFSLRR